MSDIKGVLKKGWHPKGKEGGRESWRGDFKGINQVAGWVGKGKQAGADSQENTHVSRPLASLKDPSLFGPPPKNVNYHGGAALPNEITPHTAGLGAPLTRDQLSSGYHDGSPVREEEQQTAKAAPPPLPFRADRTGLRTDILPPPPTRREVAELPGSFQKSPSPSPGPGPGPTLPPRLPSRQNTATSPTDSQSPQSVPIQTLPIRSSVPTLNQSAVNRLGTAGISVPALGIGKKSNASNDGNPWSNEQSQPQKTSDLASHFKRFNSSSATSRNADPGSDGSPTTQPTSPPTWAQTQSTLKTAQNFHKDPASVSLADAQQAAATAQQAHGNAQAFRARHAEKIDAAEKKATALNKKYNMTGRLNKFLEDANNEHDQKQQQPPQQGEQHIQSPPLIPNHPNAATVAPVAAPAQVSYQRASPPPPIGSPQPGQSIPATGIATSDGLTKSIGRKAPPPPPPKKPSKLQAPPPVPLGTRPSF